MPILAPLAPPATLPRSQNLRWGSPSVASAAPPSLSCTSSSRNWPGAGDARQGLGEEWAFLQMTQSSRVLICCLQSRAGAGGGGGRGRQLRDKPPELAPTSTFSPDPRSQVGPRRQQEPPVLWSGPRPPGSCPTLKLQRTCKRCLKSS